MDGIIGGGVVRQWTDPLGSGGLDAGDGLTALLGLQRKLAGRRSLRVDAVAEHFPSPILSSSAQEFQNTHVALPFGVNWRFRDGVIGANDASANTPAGTRVDANGCARVFEEAVATSSSTRWPVNSMARRT